MCIILYFTCYVCAEGVYVFTSENNLINVYLISRLINIINCSGILVMDHAVETDYVYGLSGWPSSVWVDTDLIVQSCKFFCLKHRTSWSL